MTDPTDDANEGDAPEGREGRFRRRVVFICSMAVLTIALGAALFFLRTLVLLLFVAVVLAVVLRAAGRAIHRHTRLPEGWATLVAALLVVLALGLVGLLIGPLMVDQITQVAQRMPQGIQNLQSRLSGYPLIEEGLRRLQDAGTDWLTTLGGQVAGQVRSLVASTLAVTSGLGFILVTGAYLAAEPRFYSKGFVRMLPRDRRRQAQTVLDDCAGQLTAWIVGQLASMVAVGTIIGVGLWLVGLPLAPAIGLLAGLLNFVPIIGQLTAAIPAVLLGLAEGGTTAFWVVAVFVAGNQIEGNILLPLIQKRAVSLPPAAVMVALFGMGELFGLFGVFVATPMLAVAMVLYHRLYMNEKAT